MAGKLWSLSYTYTMIKAQEVHHVAILWRLVPTCVTEYVRTRFS